jgi:hypothetical protein
MNQKKGTKIPPTKSTKDPPKIDQESTELQSAEKSTKNPPKSTKDPPKVGPKSTKRAIYALPKTAKRAIYALFEKTGRRLNPAFNQCGESWAENRPKIHQKIDQKLPRYI